jgi:uncharacterized membrane protein
MKSLEENLTNVESKSTLQNDSFFQRLKDLSRSYEIWIITVVALILRLINLNTSLWYDEGYSGHLARLSPSEILSFLLTEDVHMPLYFFLLRLWSVLFSDDLGLHYFSVLTGTLSVFVLYCFAEKLFNRKIALLAASFLTISTFHIQYSQEIRPYSLFIFLTCVALWVLVTAIQSKKTWNIWWFIYSFSVGLVIYTHTVGVFIFLGISALHLCLIGIKDRTKLTQWVIFNSIGGLLLLPWIPIMIQQTGKAEYAWLPEMSLYTIFSTMQWYIYSPVFKETGTFFHFLWLGPQSLLLFATLFVKDSSTRKKVFGLILFIVVPVSLISIYGYLYFNVFVNRVLGPVIISLVILSALPALEFEKTKLRRPVEILTILALLFSFISTIVYLHDRQGVDWRGTATYIEQQVQPEDAVIIMPEKAIYVFGFYYSKNKEDQKVISTTEFENITAITENLFKDHKRIWVVRDKIVSGLETSNALKKINKQYKTTSPQDFSGIEVVLVEPDK